MLAYEWTSADVITVIGVITTSIIGIITALGTLKNRDQINVVRKEVTTMNGQTLAMLADAGETRRIDLIPKVDQTAMETEHIASIEAEGGDPKGRETFTSREDVDPSPHFVTDTSKPEE